MRDERGFALIAAMWLIVVMTALGLGAGVRAREQRMATINAIQGVRERAAANAGIEHARARLSRLIRASVDADESVLRDSLYGPTDPWHLPGRHFPDTIHIGNVAYHVILRDAGSGLNLNRATPDELRRLLSGLRVDAGKADRIAQAIADWRDPDDDARARGAERRDYIQANRPLLPRNGPFQRIEELRSVAGVDHDVFRRLSPHLRLFGSGRVNVNAAPREVLLAIDGMSEEAVGVLLRYRRSGRRLQNLEELAEELSSAGRSVLRARMVEMRDRTTFQTSEVEVMSEAWVPGGITHARVDGLFKRADNSVVLAWRRRS